MTTLRNVATGEFLQKFVAAVAEWIDRTGAKQRVTGRFADRPIASGSRASDQTADEAASADSQSTNWRTSLRSAEIDPVNAK